MKIENRSIIPKKFIRDFPLVLCQIWGRRYTYIFGREITAFPRNIFIFDDGLVTLYRGTNVNSDINDVLLAELRKDKCFVAGLVEKNLAKIRLLKEKCGRALSREEFADFLNLVLDCWQGFFISLYLPPDERFTQSDRDIVMEFRKQTGDLEYDAFNHIDTTLACLYGELGNLSRFLAWEEITENKIPAEAILATRQKGKLILVDDTLVSEREFEILQKKFGFELEREEPLSKIREIKGQIACPGLVRGTVRVLLKNQDVGLVQKGEILVTSMTVPTFLPAMERASAFVTDEGGITCHAAIVAREMKKPCIIGTKIATKVLKDGMMVEVNAETGIVKIIHDKGKKS